MSALENIGDTRLSRAIAPLVLAHPGMNGLYALPAPEDAFTTRGTLAAAAEQTIDAQYYIWHNDVTGNLLFEVLWEAAERGVHVRLLLDDNNTAGLDGTLAALATHPNIQVRLFNPLVNRRARWTNYLFDFRRVNHRMHNKSFTVDNQATVVGGRNIGDEYFDAGSAVAFVDLDVLAIGPVVRKVSKAFDLFWNSVSACPAESLMGKPRSQAAARLKAVFAATHAAPAATGYLHILRERPLIAELSERRVALDWAEVQLVCDDPAKVFAANRELLLLPRLLEMIGQPNSQFDLVSPYFVPMEQGTASLLTLAKRGVKIRVLTNSLESNDVIAVHAGYAKRRKGLLRAGIGLYELKRRNALARNKHLGKGGSSAALHAKTFQIDGSRVFVGSFNFDPRSAKLNTEMGLVIESAAIAERLRSHLDAEIPKRAYEVELRQDGNLAWIETTSDGRTVYESEPGASFLRRGLVDFLSMLPIEWLL